MTYGKTNKKNKAPKVNNPSPKNNFMRESGKNTKKGGAIPMKNKRLSK
jgi:hypothetical protein